MEEAVDASSLNEFSIELDEGYEESLFPSDSKENINLYETDDSKVAKLISEQAHSSNIDKKDEV